MLLQEEVRPVTFFRRIVRPVVHVLDKVQQETIESAWVVAFRVAYSSDEGGEV